MSSESLVKESPLPSIEGGRGETPSPHAGEGQGEGAGSDLGTSRWNDTKSDIAIRVQNLSKCYHLYDQPQDRLKQSIMPRLRRLGASHPHRSSHKRHTLELVKRTTRRADTCPELRIRERVEELFGSVKAIGGQRKTRFRDVACTWFGMSTAFVIQSHAHRRGHVSPCSLPRLSSSENWIRLSEVGFSTLGWAEAI